MNLISHNHQEQNLDQLWTPKLAPSYAMAATYVMATINLATILWQLDMLWRLLTLQYLISEQDVISEQGGAKFHLVHEKKDQGGKKISFST